MITFLTGDLFAVPGLDALAQGVNCQGVMGAGIAKEFRRRWPEMYRNYRALCLRRGLRPGQVHSWQAKIFNIATQEQTGPCAQLDSLYAGLQYTLVLASAFGIRRIGMPRIGCGIGGLRWDQVRSVMTGLGSQSSVDLVVVSLPE